MSDLLIQSTVVGALQENAYLVIDPVTRDAVFIDPGDEGERLLDVLRDSGATLRAIWLTHGHVDHVGGIAAIRRQLDVPIHLHPADRALYDAAPAAARYYGLKFDGPLPPPDVDLVDGQRLHVGGATFDVAHTPGHAPGHVAFVGPTLVFGGDLLFAGSIGRTDLPYADPARMGESLERAAAWDPALVVHPGHGRSTTIGDERRSNPFLSGLARPVARR